MRVVLREGTKVYEIGRHLEVRDRGSVRSFRGEFSARTFLLRLSYDPSNMAALRTLFREEYQGSRLTELSNLQVVEAVSRQLALGILQLILRPEGPPTSFGVGTHGQSQQQATPPPPRRPRAEAPSTPVTETPPPKDSEFPADVDAAAVAAIMRQAARDGLPFCEE